MSVCVSSTRRATTALHAMFDDTFPPSYIDEVLEECQFELEVAQQVIRLAAVVARGRPHRRRRREFGARSCWPPSACWRRRVALVVARADADGESQGPMDDELMTQGAACSVRALDVE